VEGRLESQGRQAVGGAVSGSWGATLEGVRLPVVGPWDSTWWDVGYDMLCPGGSYNPEYSCCQAVSAKMLNRPAQPQASPYLRWLPYLFAAGAIFWLVNVTQTAALAAAPLGRAQLEQTLVSAGLTHSAGSFLVLYFVIVFLFQAIAIALHGPALYGLKRMRWWGWVAAVITAGAWSLIIVGIPVFVFLLQRQTRQAYGVL
jgi:hypothetical protein